MHMIRWNGICRAGVALGALTLGSSVLAQEGPTDSFISTDNNREIVVSGQKDPEPEADEVREQARAITHTGHVFSEPLASFQKPVCAGVTGLPVDLATLVVDRIRYNADRVGLELGEPGKCTVNLLVSFVIDGRALLNDIGGKGGTLLAQIPKSERRALLRDEGPVHAFVVSAYRTRDGVLAKWDTDGTYAVVNTQSANSLILLPTRKDIEMSIVLIDIPAIDGLSAVQLADYATMRGLAKTKPVEGDATYGTILNLFDENGLHAPELTNFDVAYLTTLYERPPNIAAAAKLGTIGGEMKELAAAQAAEATLSE
jgi:hypothetical protein